MMKTLVQQKDFSKDEESDDEEESKTVGDHGEEKTLVKTIISISQRILAQSQSIEVQQTALETLKELAAKRQDLISQIASDEIIDVLMRMLDSPKQEEY